LIIGYKNKGSEIEICVKIRTIQEKLNLDYKKDNGKETDDP